MAVNSIRAYRKKHKATYGNLTICCDGKTYWRKKYFPYYKAHRKAATVKSPYDWNLIFQALTKIRQELADNFPYQLINVDGAEADDVIAVLTEKYIKTEPVLILSSDKDFLQLQKFGKNVKQFSPILGKFITADQPLVTLREHIIRGDRGDGIPNILSPGDSFVSGTRQTPLSTKKLDLWKFGHEQDICSTIEIRLGYERNQTLINFEYIPTEIKTLILDSDNTKATKTKKDIMSYMIKYNLKNLMSDIQDF